MGLAYALMPKGATFHNQTVWGSIGWATPAAFGAAVAARDRHVVLVTGEGSHQLTAQGAREPRTLLGMKSGRLQRGCVEWAPPRPCARPW
jgi:TPP-dependent 2-oxoacid decarboxylase